MCGVFTSIGMKPDPARIDIVSHRGPDDCGWVTYDSPLGPVALGHRRLSIIDVSKAGHQPMIHADSGSAIVFNGEIYNYRELKAELEATGEAFHTHTDTEVLLRALVVWGEAALPRLRGMFAIVHWDDRRKRLLAARDRFGIKPLCFAQGSGSIAFGSEIKQLLGLPGSPVRMNLSRVSDFLAWGMSDHTAETMFQGVWQLRAGEYAIVDADRPGRPRLAVRRWYDPSHETLTLTASEAADRFRDLLSQSVDLHLRSDVPVGSCLSGGLDSSSIVCLMARQLGTSTGGQRVETFSACYRERSVNEKPHMDVVVAHAATGPHYIWPRAEDIFARAEEITWHQDEPVGSTSIFAQWCVFEEAKRTGVKVMLDGQGADEQLAGYVTSFPFHLAGLLRQGDARGLLSCLSGRKNLSGVPIGRQLRELVPQLLPSPVLHALHGHRRARLQYDWLGDGALARAALQTTAFETAILERGWPPARDLASLCRVMTFASNLQMLLHWEDRNSMAHGVEARVPFLDHPLVEFSLALGNAHKIVDGKTKHVLRQAMAGILPESVRNRHDKLGFATPEEEWFRGPLRGLVEDGVERTLALYPGLMNDAGVRNRARAILDGRSPFDFWVWRVVNLGLWGGRFGVELG